MKKFLLIFPPYLQKDGFHKQVESDVYYHFVSSFKKLKKKFFLAKFKKISNNRIILDLDHLEKILKNNNFNILIDCNYTPGDNCVYPFKLLEIFKNKKNIIGILPDHILKTRYDSWLSCLSFIVSFNYHACKLSNKFYKTNKFVYYNSIPVADSKINFNNFLKRPYEFCYIGSKKIFRKKFIDVVTNLRPNFSKKIIYNKYKLKKTKQYLNILSKSKFSFCTRASEYSYFRFPNTMPGRFAGRVSETISQGCIPLYWEIKNTNIFFSKIRSKILKKTDLFNNLLLKGNQTAKPFDLMKKELIKGVAIANNPAHAYNLIKLSSKNILKEKLIYSKKIYNKYIDPKNFLFFLKKKCKVT